MAAGQRRCHRRPRSDICDALPASTAVMAAGGTYGRVLPTIRITGGAPSAAGAVHPPPRAQRRQVATSPPAHACRRQAAAKPPPPPPRRRHCARSGERRQAAPAMRNHSRRCATTTWRRNKHAAARRQRQHIRQRLTQSAETTRCKAASTAPARRGPTCWRPAVPRRMRAQARPVALADGRRGSAAATRRVRQARGGSRMGVLRRNKTITGSASGGSWLRPRRTSATVGRGGAGPSPNTRVGAGAASVRALVAMRAVCRAACAPRERANSPTGGRAEVGLSARRVRPRGRRGAARLRD